MTASETGQEQGQRDQKPIEPKQTSVLVQEQIEGVPEQQLHRGAEYPGWASKFASTKIYGHISEYLDQSTINTVHEVYDAFRERTAEDMAKRFQRAIKNAKESKVMLSELYRSPDARYFSVIDYSILALHHFIFIEKVTEVDKTKLLPLLSKVFDLVSKGNSVGIAVLKLLPEDVLQKRESYLSTLKRIVSDSIENNEKDSVIVERDNAFYCIKCPEKSVITPTKFMSAPEFKDLDGALKMGDGVIRIKDGQYHDMKGKLKMTFEVGDGEKIVMTLSSKHVSRFGKIMVDMDKESCEIFSKCLNELGKEPRISKVIEAAKSFVQNNKNVLPTSSLSNTNTSNHFENTSRNK